MSVPPFRFTSPFLQNFIFCLVALSFLTPFLFISTTLFLFFWTPFFLFLASSCLSFQSLLPLCMHSFAFYVSPWRDVGCSIISCAWVWSKFMFLVSVTPKIHNWHIVSFKVGLRSNARWRTHDAMKLDHRTDRNKVMYCCIAAVSYSHIICYYPKAAPCKEPSRYSAVSPTLDFLYSH